MYILVMTEHEYMERIRKQKSGDIKPCDKYAFFVCVTIVVVYFIAQFVGAWFPRPTEIIFPTLR